MPKHDPGCISTISLVRAPETVTWQEGSEKKKRENMDRIWLRAFLTLFYGCCFSMSRLDGDDICGRLNSE